MTGSKIARGLMLLGAGVGIASVAVWALELQMNLPDWIVRVAMMKLALIASAGLLAAGALLGRAAKRQIAATDPEFLPGERAESLSVRRGDKVPNAMEQDRRAGD